MVPIHIRCRTVPSVPQIHDTWPECYGKVYYIVFGECSYGYCGCEPTVQPPIEKNNEFCRSRATQTIGRIDTAQYTIVQVHSIHEYIVFTFAKQLVWFQLIYYVKETQPLNKKGLRLGASQYAIYTITHYTAINKFLLILDFVCFFYCNRFVWYKVYEFVCVCLSLTIYIRNIKI